MANTIDYYLSKGFDKQTAAYFASGRKTFTAVRPQTDYMLLLSFDNGETRLFDAKPLIKPNTVFAPLANVETFARVYLDDDHAVSWDIDPNVDSRVVWSNKLDLCPDTCYMDSVPVEE